MNDMHYLEIGSLGTLFPERRLSPVEVAKAMLERIDRLDPKLHAYAYVMRDEAMKAARRAEEEIGQGKIRGPLHGVPIAVKDLCFTKDAPTASGCARCMPISKSVPGIRNTPPYNDLLHRNNTV